MTKYYTKVHIPVEFKERIEELMKERKAKSIQDFVTQACIDLLDYLEAH